jgi:flagellar P-ring protein precursor FlgI
MLRKMGVMVSLADLNVSNAAAVMVTARAPLYASPGSTLDAVVSSLGSATSLRGGQLLLTPLQSTDGKLSASAQGKILFNPVRPSAGKDEAADSTATGGIVPGGVMLERELNSQMLEDPTHLSVILHEPDFVTAERIVAVVKSTLKTEAASVDAGHVRVTLPDEFKSNPVGFIAEVEVLTLEPDSISRVVINEHTGTVIAGEDVKISPVAISHGHLKIEVGDPKGRGGKGSVLVVPEDGTVTTLVAMLNSVGTSPSDIAIIFKTLQRVGALRGQLVIM